MQYALEKGLNRFLLALDPLNVIVNKRIANEFANKMEKPYVVCMLNAGQDANLQQREQGEFRYAIKGVAKKVQTAGLIARVLRTGLHEQTFEIDAPYVMDRIQHTTVVKYTEMVDNVQIYHWGGIFRIRVSEEF